MGLSALAPDVASVLTENHRRFLAFLARRLPSRDVAEDLLQDAFVRGITKAPPFASGDSIVAWFYTVLRNGIVDYYRRTGAEDRAIDRFTRELATAAPSSEDPELYGEVCACVRSLVTTLKPEYADAIGRVDLDGVAVHAYARERGITANNAGVRLHRAHRALKRRIHETCRTCADHGCVQCSCVSAQVSRITRAPGSAAV